MVTGLLELPEGLGVYSDLTIIFTLHTPYH